MTRNRYNQWPPHSPMFDGPDPVRVDTLRCDRCGAEHEATWWPGDEGIELDQDCRADGGDCFECDEGILQEVRRGP